MAITKRELVVRLSKRYGIQQRLTRDLVQSFLDEVVSELARGERLEFREFGIFQVQQKNARTARNPRTGRPVAIGGRVPRFKPSKELKQAVR